MYDCCTSGGGDRGEYTMETQEDTVFIQNLPKDVTEQTLAEHFGGIGVIKVSKCTLANPNMLE